MSRVYQECPGDTSRKECMKNEGGRRRKGGNKRVGASYEGGGKPRPYGFGQKPPRPGGPFSE